MQNPAFFTISMQNGLAVSATGAIPRRSFSSLTSAQIYERFLDYMYILQYAGNCNGGTQATQDRFK